MAEITAKMVNELRAKTGQGMMECKKALAETGGDVDKAIDYFRKKGVKTSILAREAKEGRVAVSISADGRTAAAAEVLCNTDFTAKSDPLVQVGNKAVELLLKDAQARPAEDAQIKAMMTEASQRTGENVQMGRTAVLSNHGGRVGIYAHYTGKVGVLVSLGGNASDELIKDLCLHITAARPLALTREQVPADLVAKEREIAIEQAKATGKPQQIAEKIAEGKMRTFYEERVLLDQKFVKDDSKSIEQLVKSAGATLEGYVRFEVGQ